MTVFDDHLRRWQLTPDGAALHTHSSDLLPVLLPEPGQGRPAMLKLARTAEEQTGNRLMVWLAGEGAAQVYAHDSGGVNGAALLLERLNAQPSLTEMAQQGQDDQATRILCEVVGKLHSAHNLAAQNTAPPALPTLRQWFSSLEQQASQGAMLSKAWEVAQDLLDHPTEASRPLHGDIHHANVLHSTRGWLAIDPKGLLGERGYDYANILCNPNTSFALRPGRLEQQIAVIAQAANLEPQRLRRWVVAYAGLSAAWWLEDNNTAEAKQVLNVAELALSGI